MQPFQGRLLSILFEAREAGNTFQLKKKRKKMKMLPFVSNMNNILAEKLCKIDFTIQVKA